MATDRSIHNRTHDSKAATMAQSFAPIRDLCAAAGLSTARVVSPRHALVPSASRPGVTYHVIRRNDGTYWCACPAHTGCWHCAASAALLGGPTPPASTVQARAAAALDELYGPTRPTLYCEAQDAYLLPDAADPVVVA